MLGEGVDYLFLMGRHTKGTASGEAIPFDVIEMSCLVEVAGSGHTEYTALVALALAAGVDQGFVFDGVVGSVAGGIAAACPVFLAGRERCNCYYCEDH